MEWRIVNCEWNGDISEIKYKENLVKRDSMHAHAVHTSVILFAPIGEKFKKNGFTRCSLKYFFYMTKQYFIIQYFPNLTII